MAIATAFAVSLRLHGVQDVPATGLYEIVSGTYDTCCGIGGHIRTPLPSQSQSFVYLAVNSQQGLARTTFLGKDAATVFSIDPCLSGSPTWFDFNYGFIVSNSIVFHVDPGPPPYSVYWNYTVSNSVNGLQINGLVGRAATCVDAFTKFNHSNVVAVLIPPPRIRITGYSQAGASLFLQGRAGHTNVVEASADLAIWSGIATNVMPPTVCPICPFVVVQDSASTNMALRFYRCFEVP